MAHQIQNKDKLLARIKRIQGQVAAVAAALEAEEDCLDILRTVTSCRGALHGLMAELIEGHVLEHVLDDDRGPRERARATDELMNVIRTYLR